MNRILNNLLEKIATPDAGNNVMCPILRKLMDNPVMTCDGNTYDKVAIEKWLNENDTSPLTNLRLKNKNLIPNLAIRRIITEFKESQKISLEAIIELYNMHPEFISLDKLAEKILKRYISFKDLKKIYDSCIKNNNTDIVLKIRESVMNLGFEYISDKMDPEFMKLFFSEEFITDFKRNTSKSTIKIVLNQDEIDDVSYISGIIRHIGRLDDDSDNTQESIDRISILGRFIQELELNRSLSNFIFERLHSRERERRKRLMDKEDEERRRILRKLEKKIEEEEKRKILFMSAKEKLFSDKVEAWYSNIEKIMRNELDFSSKKQDGLTYAKVCDPNNNKKLSSSNDSPIKNMMISIEKSTNKFWKKYQYSNKKLNNIFRSFKVKKKTWGDMCDSDSDSDSGHYMTVDRAITISLSYADVVRSSNDIEGDVVRSSNNVVRSSEIDVVRSSDNVVRWGDMSESDSDIDIPNEISDTNEHNESLEITIRSLFHSESDEEDDY